MRLSLAILAFAAAMAGIWALIVDMLILSVLLDAAAVTLGGWAFYKPKPGEHPHSMPRDTHFD